MGPAARTRHISGGHQQEPASRVHRKQHGLRKIRWGAAATFGLELDSDGRGQLQLATRSGIALLPEVLQDATPERKVPLEPILAEVTLLQQFALLQYGASALSFDATRGRRPPQHNCEELLLSRSTNARGPRLRDARVEVCDECTRLDRRAPTAQARKLARAGRSPSP